MELTFTRAYIVNNHLADKPGEYWVAVWTENDTCELLDSNVLHLTTYEIVMSPRWLFRIYMLVAASVRQAYVWTHACIYIRFLRILFGTATNPLIAKKQWKKDLVFWLDSWAREKKNHKNLNLWNLGRRQFQPLP